MTALAAKVTGAVQYAPTNYVSAKTGANKIYKNSLVGIDETDRLMYPWGTAGKTLEFAGFAYTTYEAGSDPAYAVITPNTITGYEGEPLPVAGVTAITDEGKLIYCETDNWTTDLTITAGTTDPIGRISRFVEAGYCEVEIFVFNEAIVGTNLTVAGDLEVIGDTTLGGLLTSNMAAAEYWKIDADTVDHTGAFVFNIDLGVNSASVDAMRVNLDVGTALSGTELAKGFYVDANGKAADADSSGILAYDALVTAISTSRADLFGYRVTFDGAQDGADTTTGISIIDTQTQATSTFRGLYVNGTGYTHTSGSWYGFDIQNTKVITAGAAYGGQILVDQTDANNAKFGLLISKDLTSTAAGTTQSNNALAIASVNTNTHASIMTVSNNLIDITETNSAAAAGADVYSGTLMKLTYSATTATAGTATNTTNGIVIDYNETETAGTLTSGSFNAIYVDYDTVGTTAVALNSVRNLLKLEADDTNAVSYALGAASLNGAMIDLAGVNVASANLTAHGLYIATPSAAATSTVIGAGIYADITSASNAITGLLISKDLTNAAAGAGIAQTNSALNITSVNANAEAQIMTISNNLVSIAETNSAAAAGADVYSGNTLNLAYTATTATAGTATNSKTALNIDYNLNETAGTLSLSAFNVFQIDYDTTGTPAYATGSYNLFAILGTDAAVPAYAANSLINGINVNFTTMDISDADLTLTGLRVDMPAGASTSTVYGALVATGVNGVAFYVDATTTDHVAGNIIHVEADVADVAAGSYVSFYTNIDETVAGTNGTFIVGSDTIITGFATGRADLIGSRITIDGTKNGGDDTVGMLINVDGLTLNNAAETLSMIRLDASALTNTLSASVYGLEITAGYDYDIYASGWSKLGYVDQTAYYWKEDWDEEAAAVTRAGGLRADEWTEGGTNSAAGLYTYIASPGGALNLTTAATNDDSTWMLGILTKFNTTNNPVFEGRFKATTITTKLYYAGVSTAGVDDLIVGGAYEFAANSLVVFVDSTNVHTFGANHIVVGGRDGAGVVEFFDTGLTAVNDTYISYRIDVANVAQPKVYVNAAGGAITEANLIAITWVRGIDTATYVAPIFGVQALDAVAAPVQVDYFKAWQTRA